MPVSLVASEHCKHQLLKRVHSDIPQAIRQIIASSGIIPLPAATALLPESRTGQATLLSQQQGIFCGRDWAEAVLTEIAPSVTIQWQVEEATEITDGQPLATLRGPVAAILAAESSLLHFLQTLSGVATVFATSLRAARQAGLRMLVALNSTPGIPAALKYALLCADKGIGYLDFSDLIPVTSNHIIACGSVRAALENARWIDPDRPAEVAVTSLQQFTQAQQAGADLILLQHFSVPDIRAAARLMTDESALLVVDWPLSQQPISVLTDCGVEYLSALPFIDRQQPFAMELSIDADHL